MATWPRKPARTDLIQYTVDHGTYVTVGYVTPETPMLTLQWAGDQPFDIPRKVFLRDNTDGITESERKQVRALKIGESMQFGGGAAASSTIRRVR